jgi:hypothetical protein
MTRAGKNECTVVTATRRVEVGKVKSIHVSSCGLKNNLRKLHYIRHMLQSLCFRVVYIVMRTRMISMSFGLILCMQMFCSEEILLLNLRRLDRAEMTRLDSESTIVCHIDYYQEAWTNQQQDHQSLASSQPQHSPDMYPQLHLIEMQQTFYRQFQLHPRPN